jgi:formylglycine-generating enzyme required for sulfatase activity
MKSNRNLWLVFVLVFWAFGAQGNNVQISNVRLTGDNPGEGYVLVTFDLSWENSWRTNTGPSNWDAVWLFVKFQVDGGEWRHAWLHASGHSGGSGTASTMELGLRDDKLAFDAQTNPGIGMILYRSALGSGTFSATDVQLRWNYSVQGVAPGSVVKADVFGIEMVLVPGGPFWVGDGVSAGSFRQVADAVPFYVAASGGVLKATDDSCCDEGEITNTGIWVDGDDGVSRSADTQTDMNPDFPTGFRGFYCMKYEITQGQYRDFLNTLTRTQQNERTTSDISVSSLGNRYVMTKSSTLQWRNGLRCDAKLPLDGPVEIYCDLNGDGNKNDANDGEWIACNFLSWSDGTAYMDWSGLRPLTELEFEKTCRGAIAPVPEEYAWGTTEIFTDQNYLVSGAGTKEEVIGLGYTYSEGNAHHSNRILLDGPCRVGIFASSNLNTGRVSSGASFYGAMELSGNLWEHVVSFGNLVGRSFLGTHGDGLLSSTGNTNEMNWPSSNGLGAGFRGGGWLNGLTEMRISYRYFGAFQNPSRPNDYGFRGSRSVHPSGAGY